jgi:cytochrome c-type biogenesis protein CcmH
MHHPRPSGAPVRPGFARAGVRAVALAALVFATGALAPRAAFAIDTERAFDDPALQARYENLNRVLRCLVCQNQTIADSNAGLAADLRREVREMITAGKSDDEIRKFMTDRYGDFVLYDPPLTARTYVLWAAPVLLLAIAGFVIVTTVRRRAAQPIDADPEESA